MLKRYIGAKSFLILFVFLFALVTFAFYYQDNSASQKFTATDILKIKSQLISEFDGAYPEKANPNGIVREFNLVAKESEVEIIPGYKTKVWSYNGQVPGPSLKIKLGETIRINFKNLLPQETTIHFHGVRVPNAMDGVPGVTQDPIKPGESFVYEFTPKDPGTYWFHPHVRSFEQIERGLFGTLIIEDEFSEKYDKDELWVIDDWRLDRNAQVFERFMIMPDLMHDGRWGNVITVNAKAKGELKLKAGERARLRFTNTSNGRIYKLYFGDLNAKAIAVDGMYVKEPFDPNGFELAPGNRLDIDIKTSAKDKGKVFKVVDRFLGQENLLGEIIVENSPASVKDRSFDYPKNPKVPDWDKAFVLPVDKLYVLDRRMIPLKDAKNKEMYDSGMGHSGGMSGMGMGMMGGGFKEGRMVIQWTINGKAYPDFDPVTLYYGEFNKIRFRNDSPNYHPMHLHGQFFKLIARDGKAINEKFFRDTVIVAPNETVDLGFIPYDLGKWMSHCHILEHADAGMMTIVEVKEKQDNNK
jgi:FtsP/CotA-like multicopper oxidase with cupredoxin domain